MNRLAAAALVAAILTTHGPSAARTVGEPTVDEREIGAARNALIMGDNAAAVTLFEALYERMPDDPRVLWGLVRAYTASGMDRERVVPLLAERLRRIPSDDQARRELGEAYARIGERALAHETWIAGAASGRADADRYYDVGSLEMQYRMYEHAEVTYREGRTRLSSPTMFAEELAQVYTALRRFDEAIDECLLAVEEHPAMAQWAVNNVELMIELGAPRDRIERRVTGIAKAEGSSPAALAFAGSVLLAFGRHDDALAAYTRADGLHGAKGEALLEFAGILEDEGRPAEARRAYLSVVERAPGSAQAATAGTKAALLRAASGDPEGAVAELRAVAEASADHPAAGDALLEAARIELYTLDDPAGALETVGRIPAAPRLRRSREEAELVAIDAALALGDVDGARARAAALAGGAAEAAVRGRAMYAGAYAAFLALDTAAALDGFRALVTMDVSGPLVNDALRLMLVLSDADETGDEEPLRLLVSAHVALRRGDREGARAAVAALASASAAGSAATEGLLLLARAAEADRDADRALAAYAAVLEGSASLAARAHAMMRRGDILAAAGRSAEAMVSYRGILEELPANFLSGEARRKLDELRRALPEG